MLVWGFTAAVLDRILELGGWAGPWDTEDVRDLPEPLRDLARRGVPPGYIGPRGGPQLPEFADPASSDPDDGPSAEDVVPADEHGTAAPADGGRTRTAGGGTVAP
jgi:hypothetical protein